MSDPAGKIIRSAARYPGVILAKAKITPNQVTMAGFFINCAVAYLIAMGRLGNLAVGLLIWAGGFVDALDGSVARATSKMTAFGNFFDSVLDRYSDSVIYLGIMIYFLKEGRADYAILVVIAAVGSLIISYTRAKAESLGQKCEVGLIPRTVRIIILGASFLVGQVFWGLAVIAVLSHITVLQRIIYVRNSLHK